MIKQKLNDYKILIPYFFGWFMNLNDSNELVTKTKNIFDTCVKNCHQFTLELMTETGKIRDE